ncbi:MAG: PLP-dependent aminotransferase family protein [Acidobacteriota bacterium]
METLWSQRYALRTRRMQSSIVRELLKLIEKPDLISFAGGLPAPEVFPIEEFREAAERVLSESGPQSLQYSTTEGCPRLREMIARHTARYGIVVKPENILITSGSQQALDLIGKVFLNSGDRIALERPTYLGALQAWNAYQAQFLGIGMDDEGMRTDDLESVLRGGPKFLYALPNFQNPTGVTLSLKRREIIIDMADHFGVPIIEDDPYGQLRYEGEHLPSLAVMDARARGDKPFSGNVIYLSTFSKTLAPGLRLAWIVAPVEVIQKLVQAKQGTDLHTGTFVQMVAFELARGGFLDKHVLHIRSVYGVRREAILAALAKHMPEGVRWTRPQGGLFIWAILPELMDATALLREAIEEKVAFVPGTAFYDDGSGKNTMRLNFSNATPEKIEEGIARLGAVIQRALARQREPVLQKV